MTTLAPIETASSTERDFRILLSFLRPYRATIALGGMMGIVTTVANLWTPRIIEYVIEALTVGSSITGYIVMFAVVTVISIVAMFAQFAILGRAGEVVVYDVRSALVARLLKGRVSDVLSRSAGDLVSRATADAPLLQFAVSSGFVAFVTAITGVVGSIIFMGVIDGPMLGITLGAVALIVVIMALFQPKVGRERASAQEAVGAMGGDLDQSIRSLRAIKVLGAEGLRSEAVLEHARKARRHGISAVLTETTTIVAGIGGMSLVTVFALGFGAWRVTEGHLTIAALVAFVMYAMNFIGPLMEVSDGLMTITTGIAASKRIAEAQEIELEEDDVARPAATAAVPPSRTGAITGDTPIIEFRDVTASYNPRDGDVVAHLDLRIPRTGHVAIVGPSGAGKTSMMSLMLRFLSPRQGHILLNGVPYEDLPYAQVRGRFAYVEQEPTVLPGTIRDNLVVARPGATDAEVFEALRAVHLDGDIAQLPDGLDTELVAATMTGGGRQRLAIARALLRDPDVLLLDEPTSQINGSTEEAIHEAIDATATQRAVVTIAHREETVRTADTVVVMDQGSVRAVGTHAELLATDALYQELMSNLRINDGA
ncbi:ABC transporter ATP-binding protein [Xylanimonas sp. McL0601]|uniref:ABC transporter ATP-binding protein n=1 Tax=Xylanimonas sp. McL0601 TaxID=3414739 RepID=UPI003CF9F478